MDLRKSVSSYMSQEVILVFSVGTLSEVSWSCYLIVAINIFVEVFSDLMSLLAGRNVL